MGSLVGSSHLYGAGEFGTLPPAVECGASSCVGTLGTFSCARGANSLAMASRARLCRAQPSASSAEPLGELGRALASWKRPFRHRVAASLGG